MINGRITELQVEQSTPIEKVVRLTFITDESLNKFNDLVHDNNSRQIFIGSGNTSNIGLYGIKNVYVNEVKRTVTIKFIDETVSTATCHEDDEFDVYAGFAIALTSHICGSKNKFHTYVDKKIKKSKNK